MDIATSTDFTAVRFVKYDEDSYNYPDEPDSTNVTVMMSHASQTLNYIPSDGSGNLSMVNLIG